MIGIMKFSSKVDITSALRRLADRRIEEAMKEGKFENLTGKGLPLELEPMPAEEDARLAWWCVRILKQNDVTPDEIRLRKTVDVLKSALASTQSASEVRQLTNQINEVIRRINTLGTNTMQSPMAPIDLDAQLKNFQTRQNA
jgi:hypothetical protein